MRRLVSLVKPKLEGLGLACLLAVVLLLLSYVRLAGDTLSVAFSNVVHDSVMAGSIWGTTLGRSIMRFAATVLLLHLALGAGVWILARASAFAFPGVRVSLRQWIFAWASLAGVTLLIANAGLAPHTSLGQPYAALVRKEVAGLSLFAFFTGTALIAAGVTLAIALTRAVRQRARVGIPAAVAGVAVSAIVAAAAVPDRRDPAPPTEKPHVILIGIDSLRFDETQPGGPVYAENIARFLKESVSFSDATTPLARTFPSWVSVLSGRHPHTTGAIINLLPRRRIDTGETLGDLFRAAGYRTVYGIDEVRFSNVDASYGFDQTITPPIGASDFLIGWFGDTPLSNLLVNTRLGALLFPHLHANRGAAKIYDPDQFVARLARELDFGRPTFLAMHLTLAHWPFHWIDSPPVRPIRDQHAVAIRRVDRQFADVLKVLETRGALANALVIVFSDHGEAIGLDGDGLLRQEHALAELFEEHKRPHGHGTDVLSPKQYQVVLGMRCFGRCPMKLPAGGLIGAPVSLVDIAPTLADLFGLQARTAFDGRSLKPLLEGAPDAAAAFQGRIRFTESEFNPVGVMSSGTVSFSAAAAAALFYTIDPVTDRIEVRPDRLPEILRYRQYAAFDEKTLLAALPHPSGTGYELIAIDRSGERAERLHAVPGPEAHAELVPLYRSLTQRFGLAGTSSPNGGAH